MDFEGLTRLEDIVGRLLSQYAEVKKQNEILASDVAEQKVEIDRLHDKILAMRGDKEDVHHRVSSILTKLEEWERVKDDSCAVSHEQESEALVAQESQKHLFDMGV